MLKVGLTGGIGSGKSTVARIFHVLGVPVLDADATAKMLMNEDPALRKALQSSFGADIYKNSTLDRKALAQIVFNNPGQLKKLNSLVHPAVFNYSDQWMKQQHTSYAIKEAAIFFETGSDKEMDVMVGVTAPMKLRIERVVTRDNALPEEVKHRIENQMPEAEKMKKCDWVIYNDNKHSVIEQVLAIHNILLNKSKQKK